VPKLFDCDECGAAIDSGEDYVEVKTQPHDPGESPHLLRIHTYLCLPVYHLMHPCGARFKETK
jgi:hypothetical protein